MNSNHQSIGVLFVCIGNICRSPTAEGVFISLVQKAVLQDKIHCDSAGMSDYHTGERPHAGTLTAASKRGYDLPSRARQFTKNDFEKFDYIVPMDESNYDGLKKMASTEAGLKKIFPFIEFCKNYKDQHKDVPDPYYGGREDFDLVLDICEEGCQELLDTIVRKLS